MSLRSIATAAMIGAGLSIAAHAQSSPQSGASAPLGVPAYAWQGWGLAISYEVIGEICPRALSVAEMTTVKAYIAAGLADAKKTDGTFDHDQFVRSFRADMIVKYADPTNCTAAAINEARAAIEAMRTRGSTPQ